MKIMKTLLSVLVIAGAAFLLGWKFGADRATPAAPPPRPNRYSPGQSSATAYPARPGGGATREARSPKSN